MNTINCPDLYKDNNILLRAIVEFDLLITNVLSFLINTIHIKNIFSYLRKIWTAVQINSENQ